MLRVGDVVQCATAAQIYGAFFLRAHDARRTHAGGAPGPPGASDFDERQARLPLSLSG